ncbi:MAG: restriction endonuclease subunit S [Lachnospira sp.]|nr:restriction endonuclease subunit S [Lachnospira sp.]
MIELSNIYLLGSDSSYYEKFADGTKKYIDSELPFEIPESWEWCRLKNILDVKGGKRLPKGKKLQDTPSNHIYIRVTDMKEQSISSEKIMYISDEIYAQIKNYTISSDDLYLTIAGTIGNCGIVPPAFNNMNLTENAVKLTHIKVNKLYLLKIIQSEFVQKQFSERTNKVAQPKLAITRILTALVPLPPLCEQKRIENRITEIISLL